MSEQGQAILETALRDTDAAKLTINDWLVICADIEAVNDEPVELNFDEVDQ